MEEGDQVVGETVGAAEKPCQPSPSRQGGEPAMGERETPPRRSIEEERDEKAGTNPPDLSL
jgi:hypothetical protein